MRSVDWFRSGKLIIVLIINNISIVLVKGIEIAMLML